LLVGFVGLGALGTFWLNSRVYRITERGQVTDRYSKAIEQLGSPTLDVRLGGIYALEQIAKDSARVEEDQRTIVEVLSAFVRVHSDPVYQYKASGPAANDRTEASDDELAETAATYVAKRTKPPVDVQAAVTVLGRLPLYRAVPRGDFTEAYLAHIRLDVGANLTGARLNGANLTSARLNGANLTSAWLNGANLTGAQLPRADLTKAYLNKANLTSARLNGANLTGAELNQADLASAELIGTDLTGAQLTGTSLTGARLYRADLTEAYLNVADLSGAEGLSQEQLDAAFGTVETELPDDLQRPASWGLSTPLRPPSHSTW
jgi:uncharacterized protein YjbI with pentapeptide repeats